MLQTVHQTRTALGTSITLLMVTELDQQATNEIFRQLWLKILWFEKRFSRFLPDSEISQFNQAAGTRQYISPEFHDILVVARDMSTLSGGLFNPFILPALQRAGYKQSFLASYGTDRSHDYSDRSVVGMDALKMGDDWAEIPYGTTIHIGGCGKGYIGDELVKAMQAFPKVVGYWFSIGGDVVAYGTDCYGAPWTIQIDSAKRGRTYAGSVVMTAQESRSGKAVAVATSSVTKRKGVHNGKPWHHIIDPRTGQPSDSDVITATVKAGSLTEADVTASNVIIVGSAQADEYCREHSRSVEGMLLQRQDRSGHWRDVLIGQGIGQPKP